MNDQINQMIKDIGSVTEREKVSHFVSKELSVYVKKLDAVVERIKKSNTIEKPIFKQLKSLNDAIVQDLENLSKRIDDPRVVKTLGKIFRESRPQYFYSSEIMDKGFKKYRGYPGDFEMMNYVYDNKICSKDILGQYFDFYFLENAYSEAVRGRKNKMVGILDGFINKSKLKSLDILNLPCGPARDIKELLENVTLKKDVAAKVTCVDQDDDALAFAEHSIQNKNLSASAAFKKGNILNYVRSMNKYIDEMGQYDLVYSIGLADYLPDKLLQNMILFSYRLLKPKGIMTYAFKISDKDPFAPLPPKWFCDWHFVSRNMDDAWRVIKESGVENYEIKSEEWEESGRIAFLTIGKT